MSKPSPHPDAAHCAVRLRGAVTLLSRRLRPAPQQGGTSVAKLSVIGQLYRAGPLTPTELAEREGVKLQSLTRLLAELEGDGWVARKADASDGRRSLLSLTRLGSERLTVAVHAGEASLARVIESTLGDQERALLMEACVLMEAISEALAAEAADPVDATPRPGAPRTKRVAERP
jgi:DNA-binding MarR family transcriptional regulator